MSLTSQRKCLEIANYISVYYMDLPCRVRGFVKILPDDCYAIVLNSKLSTEQNNATLSHELEHIENSHFYQECRVDRMESALHAF